MTNKDRLYYLGLGAIWILGSPILVPTYFLVCFMDWQVDKALDRRFKNEWEKNNHE